MNIIDRLYSVILERKADPRPDSYVCRLLEKGEDGVLKKVGEEAVEVILAAKERDDDALVGELADLTFHALVLMGARGVAPERVAQELERRFGTSGVAEKARRGGEA
jgi:phosphoribosyl-ATP pyrophosphohydrolase